MKPGVYIHIPFCEQRCYYCAFTVVTAPEATYEPYVRRLIEEIRISGFAANRNHLLWRRHAFPHFRGFARRVF